MGRDIQNNQGTVSYPFKFRYYFRIKLRSSYFLGDQEFSFLPSFKHLSSTLRVCSSDNAIKNHFYSSLRKNISRISKDVVTLDQKLSTQARNQSIYLISYLKTLLVKQLEAEN